MHCSFGGVISSSQVKGLDIRIVPPFFSKASTCCRRTKGDACESITLRRRMQSRLSAKNGGLPISARTLRIANLNPLFPYLKSIHSSRLKQYLSHTPNLTTRKTLKYAPNQGNSTNQKTTNSRSTWISSYLQEKDHGGPVKPNPCRFTPNPRKIFVVAGG